MKDDKKIKILKALANPTRLTLVRQLNRCAGQQKSCADLSEKSLLSQPTLSHHFTKLLEAGIITERKVDTRKIYHLEKQLLSSHGIDIAKM